MRGAADVLLRELHPDLPRSLDEAERVEVASHDDDLGFVRVPGDDTVRPGAFIRRRLSSATLRAIEGDEGDDEEGPHAGGTHPLPEES